MSLQQLGQESLVYLFAAGILHACFFVIILLVLAVVKLIVPSLRFGRCVALVGLFNLWLLTFGTLGELVWVILTYNRLYQNPDPLIHWLPFLPPGDWMIDPICGGALLAGTTWPRMYLFWVFLALPVWLLTVGAYAKTKLRFLTILRIRPDGMA